MHINKLGCQINVGCQIFGLLGSFVFHASHYKLYSLKICSNISEVGCLETKVRESIEKKVAKLWTFFVQGRLGLHPIP